MTEPVNGPCEVVVESVDPDEINTTLTASIDLSRLTPGQRITTAELGTIPYLRPAGSGEVTLVIRRANGGGDLSEPFRVRSLRPRDPLSYIVLTLGAPVPGFDLPKPATNVPDTMPGLRGGRVEQAEITRFNQLPGICFGYENADLIVLNTGPGSEEFLTQLFGDGARPFQHIKRNALVEWVRRGGRLVVTVGANAPLVAKLTALQELLPFAVNTAQPNRSVSQLLLSWTAPESSRRSSTLSDNLAVKGLVFPVANLTPKPGKPAQVLIPTRERLKDERDAIAAQSAYGLGRVTVIAFDLDRPPFTELGSRAGFWDWVLREGGANRASAGSEGKTKPGTLGLTEEEDELAVALRSHNDTFDGVPVVSFGWVALLIVLYLLLIGPLEYFLLKRLFGRLELTWITFPIIVLTVSIAAYYSADSLKGRELKINKLDIIDIDPASERIYGTTWFTIFSPRIENYTLGVTPGEAWSSEPVPEGTTVNWIGPPRGGKASLLRRSYEYHLGEDALVNVPIQVWSTKAFSANWSGQLAPGMLVESRLEHPPGDPSTVIGTFVNRLPIPVLSDCTVFYAGNAYPLPGGTIHSGDTIRLVLDKATPATQWLQKESRLEDVLRGVPTYSGSPGKSPTVQPATGLPTPADATFPLWGLLFHESAMTYGEGVVPRNASLRRLDQSWRLDAGEKHQVILVGRASPPNGPAEKTLSGPYAPSRLWLKGVPSASENRPPLPGSGRQETWVRVYLPIR